MNNQTEQTVGNVLSDISSELEDLDRLAYQLSQKEMPASSRQIFGLIQSIKGKISKYPSVGNILSGRYVEGGMITLEAVKLMQNQSEIYARQNHWMTVDKSAYRDGMQEVLTNPEKYFQPSVKEDALPVVTEDDEFIEKLKNNIKYHMNPYTLGDRGETAQMILQLISKYQKLSTPTVLSEERLHKETTFDELIKELEDIQLSLPDTEGVNKTLLKSVRQSFKIERQIYQMSFPNYVTAEQIWDACEKRIAFEFDLEEGEGFGMSEAEIIAIKYEGNPPQDKETFLNQLK